MSEKEQTKDAMPADTMPDTTPAKLRWVDVPESRDEMERYAELPCIYGGDDDARLAIGKWSGGVFRSLWTDRNGGCIIARNVTRFALIDISKSSEADNA